MEFNNFIAIGRIVKPIGIKGNLKIIPLTDFPERFKELKKISLYNEKESKFFLNRFEDSFEFSISECRIYNGYLNIRFIGYDNIDDSKKLIGAIVMIDEKHRMKLNEGSFYFYELVGMVIFNNEVSIGTVDSIVNYGSGDLFNIKHNGKELLIPFQKEFVKNIDIKNKRIDVDLIEGFLDS